MRSNLCRLSNSELFRSAHAAVKEERRAAIEVLNHLRAIEDRKLYLERGYPSLFELCVREFSYSNGAAQRRIQAMRLIKSVPEVQEKIASGQVTITSAASIQSFLQNEKREGTQYTKNAALELLAVCAGKSSREVEKELATRNPDFARRDSVRAVDGDYMRVTFNVTDKFWRKFEQLKALRSHANHPGSNEELLDWLVELGLDKVDPERKAERSAKRSKKAETREAAAVAQYPAIQASIIQSRSDVSLPAPDEAACRELRTRYITSRERHLMAPSRKYGCGFVDHKTGRQCGSQYYLQLDHVVLFSEGGLNEAANLQWRCGEHNRASYDNSRVESPTLPYGDSARQNSSEWFVRSTG